MTSLDPEWTERLDTPGQPRNPLGVNNSRNNVVDLHSFGLVTQNPLKARYLSLYSWILGEFESRSITDDAERDRLLKNIEKVVALASKYEQLREGWDYEPLRAVTGFRSLGLLDLDDFAQIDLDEVELQSGDGYGYQEHETAMRKFLLKRGGYTLTGMGASVAEAASAYADHGDHLFQIADQGTLEEDDFERFVDGLPLHAIHTRSDDERFAAESEALRKVLLGFLEWRGDPRSGTVDIMDGPDTIRTGFIDRLYDRLQDGTGTATDHADTDQDGIPVDADLVAEMSSTLHQNFSTELHEIRRVTALFYVLTWGHHASGADPVELSPSAKQTFGDHRRLMDLYWLQVYAGYAMEALLEALTMIVDNEVPPRVPLTDVLGLGDGELVARAGRSALELEAATGSEATGHTRFARHLMLFGEARRATIEVSIPAGDCDWCTWGALREQAQDVIASAPGLAGVNEVTIAKAVRSALEDLHDADRERVAGPWSSVLGRSLALLAYVVERVEVIRQSDPELYALLRNQLSERPGNSLAVLYDYARNSDDNLALAEFACQVLQERVLRVHEQITYNRLRPGNLQRIVSLNRDRAVCLRVKNHDDRPFRASVDLVRFDEMNTLLRDLNLLTGSQNDGYEPTSLGLSLLTRAMEGDPP